MHKSLDLSTKALIRKGLASLVKLTAYNINTADCWVYVYDAADVADVTLGTTPHKARVLVPGGSGSLRGANGEDFLGVDVTNGIVIGVLTVAGSAPGSAVEVEVAL